MAFRLRKVGNKQPDKKGRAFLIFSPARYSRLAIVSIIAVLIVVGSVPELSIESVYASPSVASIQHVVLIMMENHGYHQIIGNVSAPFENLLATNYAVATNYHSTANPSQENYLEITSGSNDNLTNCDAIYSTCHTSNSNIFSLVSSHGYTWESFEESMPSNCYPSNYGAIPNFYRDRHNPAAFYTDIASACQMNDVPFGNISTKTGRFFQALSASDDKLPTFSFITPNDCNDMEACLPGQNPISVGDQWLSVVVPAIMNSQTGSDTVIFITFDSSCQNCPDYASNLVPMFVVGPPSLVTPGRYGTYYNHYSTLATIEKIFHLGDLGRSDVGATPMSAILAPLGSSSSTTTFTTSKTSSTNSPTISSTTTVKTSTSTNTRTATTSTTPHLSTSSSRSVRSSSTTTSSSSTSMNRSSSTNAHASTSSSSSISASTSLSSSLSNTAPSAPPPSHTMTNTTSSSLTSGDFPGISMGTTLILGGLVVAAVIVATSYAAIGKRTKKQD